MRTIFCGASSEPRRGKPPVIWFYKRSNKSYHGDLLASNCSGR